LVAGTPLPAQIKSAISTELKYYYASALAQNIGSRLNNRKNRADFNLRFIDTVLANFQVPAKSQLDVSVSANYYLDKYLQFKLWKAMYFFGADAIRRMRPKALKTRWGGL